MSYASRSNLFKAILVIFACATFALAAFAQSTVDGAIAGMVTDQSTAVVVGAKVTVRNIDTNAVSTAATDPQGKFRAIHLQPGTYSVTVESSNFAPVTQPKVIVEVGAITNVELSLAVAGSKETVEVSAEAPTVNTQQQDFNSNINQTTINNLPINGRRWSTFALLTPGATPDGGFGLISFRGISGLLNNTTVDGGDNNQAFFSEERGRTRASYTVSQNSIREFQVNTSNYSSEYGRAAGGVVNSVTKSGTNAIHGEVFYYVRDNTFGATNPFTYHTIKNADGTYAQEKFKPEDRRQQFGGNIGGAIIKDKLFYFFNYDGQRRNFPGVGIPSSFKLFDAFQGAFVDPQTLINAGTGAPYADRTCANILAGKTPAKGEPGFTEGETFFCRGITSTQAAEGLSFLQAETGTVPRKGDQDIFFPKLDWVVNSKNTVTVSYNRMRWNSPAGVQTQPTVTYGVASFGNDGVKTDMMNARLASTLTNNITNEFRYQYGRDFEFQSSQEPTAMEKQYNLNSAPDGRLPYVKITGGINFGRADFLERAAYPDETRNQFADTMSWMYGKHLFKFGTDINRNNDRYSNLYQGGGVYSYNNRADFISDLINAQNDVTGRYYNSYTQGLGPLGIEFHTLDYGFFFQDDVKVLPRLTLNLGLRYEYEQLPDPKFPNSNWAPTEQLHRDKNNIGPRVGFAYDVFGNGKTAIRGGYGLYYGRINNGVIGNTLFNTGAAGTQTSVKRCATSSSTCAQGPIFPNILPNNGGTPTGPAIAYLDPKIQTPQIHQADLIVEQEIAKNTVVSASYLLSLGRQLPQFIDTNVAASTRTITYDIVGGPLDGKQLTVPFYDNRNADLKTKFGTMMDVRSNINSSYNALVLQLNRKMTSNLQFLANYTWSHAIDDGQNSLTMSPTYANVVDPNNTRWEHGTSNFDIRHRFTATAVWQPAFFRNSNPVLKAVMNGWSFAPVVILSTGRPYTEGVSGSAYFGPTKTNGANGGFNGYGGNYRVATLLQRNAWRYPSFYNTDLRLSRSFKVTERHKVEFMAEAFNLFNRQQITGLNTGAYITAAGPTGANGVLNFVDNVAGSAPFGSFSQAGTNLYRERQIQFAARYSF